MAASIDHYKNSLLSYPIIEFRAVTNIKLFSTFSFNLSTLNDMPFIQFSENDSIPSLKRRMEFNVAFAINGLYVFN